MKRCWSYVAVICLLLLGMGCGSSYELARAVGALKAMPEGRVFPVEPKFTIQPGSVAESAGINFEAVYYLDHRSLPGVTSDGVQYFRFWPDGKAMLHFAGRKPTSDEADRFDGAWMGYYQVKEGKLVVELFAPKLKDYRWTYWKLEAVIEGEQIRLVREEKNRRSETMNRVYVKHQVKGMKRTPDW